MERSLLCTFYCWKVPSPKCVWIAGFICITWQIVSSLAIAEHFLTGWFDSCGSVLEGPWTVEFPLTKIWNRLSRPTFPSIKNEYLSTVRRAKSGFCECFIGRTCISSIDSLFRDLLLWGGCGFSATQHFNKAHNAIQEFQLRKYIRCSMCKRCRVKLWKLVVKQNR